MFPSLLHFVFTKDSRVSAPSLYARPTTWVIKGAGINMAVFKHKKVSYIYLMKRTYTAIKTQNNETAQ